MAVSASLQLAGSIPHAALCKPVWYAKKDQETNHVCFAKWRGAQVCTGEFAFVIPRMDLTLGPADLVTKFESVNQRAGNTVT